MKTKAILTDVEGTTSSIAFVKEVLFPYSRRHLAEFVEQHAKLVAPYLDKVRQEVGSDLDTQGCISTLERWIDEDRKIFALKALQGMIWRQGYQSGQIKGHMYPDTAPNLRHWKSMGLKLYVYSSGSVEAQKLIFGYSVAGDLTYLLSGYFDTAIGGKLESHSYTKICSEIKLKPKEILFLSDNISELSAASQAGMQAIGLSREGSKIDGFQAVSNFYDINIA